MRKPLNKWHGKAMVCPGISAGTSLVLVIFLAGCTQRVMPTYSNSTPALMTTDWTSPDFVNPENPYDSIGKIHNLGMDYVYTELNGSTDTNLAETYECQFFEQRWGYNADTMKMFLDTIKYWEQNGTHTEVLDSLQGLWGADFNFPKMIGDADSIAMDTNMNADSALTEILLIEDSIINDHSVTPLELKLGLPFLAFMRYSYAYCHSSSIDKWPRGSRTFLPKRATPLGLGDGVGGADLTGAAGGASGGFVSGTGSGATAGFLAAGPMGALLGGAGAGANGFMTGGLTGGLGASISQALTGTTPSFWDSFIQGFVSGLFSWL